ERERQVAMRDRAAERALPSGTLDIYMDPLAIAGAVRELVDARLLDRQPVGGAELRSDEAVGGRHAGSGDRQRRPPLTESRADRCAGSCRRWTWAARRGSTPASAPCRARGHAGSGR